MSVLIHHVELFTKRCAMRATLNGVPIGAVATTTPDADHFAPPINPFLIGEGNVLEVSISPTPDDDGELTTWAEAEVDIAVRSFEKGGVVVPGAGGTLITEEAFMPELARRIADAVEADEELEVPQDFLHIFDTQSASFAEELVEADPYFDRDALTAYALHIRDIFRAGDVDAFISELTPKAHVWASAYNETVDSFLDGVRTGLSSEFIPAGVITDFEAGDIELHSVAGGRMWSLERAGRSPLIQTEPDTDDAFMTFEIIAAPRDGQLRIVR